MRCSDASSSALFRGLRRLSAGSLAPRLRDADASRTCRMHHLAASSDAKVTRPRARAEIKPCRLTGAVVPDQRVAVVVENRSEPCRIDQDVGRAVGPEDFGSTIEEGEAQPGGIVSRPIEHAIGPRRMFPECARPALRQRPFPGAQPGIGAEPCQTFARGEVNDRQRAV